MTFCTGLFPFFQENSKKKKNFFSIEFSLSLSLSPQKESWLSLPKNHPPLQIMILTWSSIPNNPFFPFFFPFFSLFFPFFFPFIADFTGIPMTFPWNSPEDQSRHQSGQSWFLWRSLGFLNRNWALEITPPCSVSWSTGEENPLKGFKKKAKKKEKKWWKVRHSLQD